MSMDINNIGGMANSNQQVGGQQGLGMIQGVWNRGIKRAIKGANQRALFKNQAELERYKSQNRREELADKYRLKEEYESRNPGKGKATIKAGLGETLGKTAGELIGGGIGTLAGPEGTVLGAKIGGALGQQIGSRSAQFLQPDEGNAGKYPAEVLNPKPRPAVAVPFSSPPSGNELNELDNPSSGFGNDHHGNPTTGIEKPFF